MTKANVLLILSGLTLGLLVAGCDGGDDGSGTGGSGGSAAVPGCDEYCAAVMANCTADNQQYSTMESCVGACAAFDPGKVDDTAGNTVGCRTYHAGAAEGDPATHCVHAGPGGASACGTNVDGFCAIAVRVCPAIYADDASCREEANQFADTEPYDVSDVAGDTLACRLYHLTVAASSAGSAEMHCPHINAASPVCIDSPPP
jgi:hypothetical protein